MTCYLVRTSGPPYKSYSSQERVMCLCIYCYCWWEFSHWGWELYVDLDESVEWTCPKCKTKYCNWLADTKKNAHYKSYMET
jgi:hypothetical protein